MKEIHMPIIKKSVQILTFIKTDTALRKNENMIRFYPQFLPKRKMPLQTISLQGHLICSVVPQGFEP